MNIKNHVFAFVSGTLIFFSSCKKDVIAPEEEKLTLSVSSDATANDVPETAPAIHTPKVVNVNSNVAGYYESLPARYKLTTKNYPMILFIHGIGELGTGVTRLNCCGLPRHLNRKEFPAEFVVNGKRHSFIIISPQFKKRPSAADMQSVIDYAKKNYRIDPSRIYIAGLSMGGGSTFDYSVVYGQNVAAAVPVCAGTKPTTSLAKSIASKNLPVWTISSSADKVVPIQWAKDWINWIDQNNPNIASKTKLTVWSSENHNATWGRAFDPKTKVDGYSVYEWMLLHQRGSTPAPAPAPAPSGTKPVARAGNDQTVPLEWNHSPLLNATTSSDPDGWIASFQWTKVSGPSSYSFANPTAGQTKVNNLVAGTYVFRVTVKDNKGNTAYDDVSITMTGKSSGSSSGGGAGAPVARAGNDQTVPLEWNYAPLLNATTSKDNDGWIKSFKWTKIGGPSSYSFSNANGGQTKVHNLTAGTYTFRVAVTDNDNNVSYDDVVITMTGKSSGSAGGAPIARAGNDQTIPKSWNYSPLLNATTSKDTDGWIKSFKWQKVGGPGPHSFSNINGGQTKVHNLIPGTYTFRVTVTDNENKTSTDDVVIRITNN